MSVGDVHSSARGSGARFNDGKAPMELIPLHLLASTARVFGYGRNKYAAWNWAKGMDWSIPIGCMKRHIAAFERGEDQDPESGESHMGHIICNALMLEHYRATYRAGDDRPKEWFGGARETTLSIAGETGDVQGPTPFNIHGLAPLVDSGDGDVPLVMPHTPTPWGAQVMAHYACAGDYGDPITPWESAP